MSSISSERNTDVVSLARLSYSASFKTVAAPDAHTIDLTVTFVRSSRWNAAYSHSIVPGGLLVMSYTTRLIPRTSLTILLEIVLSTS